jgi:hypothetical protein
LYYYQKKQNKVNMKEEPKTCALGGRSWIAKRQRAFTPASIYLFYFVNNPTCLRRVTSGSIKDAIIPKATNPSQAEKDISDLAPFVL